MDNKQHQRSKTFATRLSSFLTFPIQNTVLLTALLMSDAKEAIDSEEDDSVDIADGIMTERKLSKEHIN